MPTVFYATANNFETTTPGYTAGASSLVMAAGSGALLTAKVPAGAPSSLLPVVVSTLLADGTPKWIAKFTGLSTDTLTGKTILSGTDADLPADSIVSIRWTREHAEQITTALTALETAPPAHTHDDRYYTDAEVDALLTAKAPLASPPLTGTPTAPTAAPGTNTTQVATTAFVLANGGGGGGVTDHGDLDGLADDDHPQYHTDARALTWIGTRSTSDLAEGSRLYYTDVRADARIATALAAHVAAADPHPVYLTAAEGAATYQPLDADLTALAGLSSADSNIIVGSASGWVAESGATARASLGLAIGTDVLAPAGDGSGLTIISSGGSEARSLANRFGTEVTNVLDYASFELAKAAAEAVSGGRRPFLYLPPRDDYELAGMCLLNTDGFTIWAPGAEITPTGSFIPFLVNKPTGDPDVLLPVYDLLFYGLRVNLPAGTGAGASTGVFNLNHAVRFYAEGLSVVGPGQGDLQDYLSCSQGSRGKWFRCRVDGEGEGKAGGYASTGCDQVDWVECSFENIGGAVSGVGLLPGIGGGSVVDCIIRDCAGEGVMLNAIGASGIWPAAAPSRLLIRGTRVSGCMIGLHAQSAIGGVRPADIDVDGGYYNDNAQSGINLASVDRFKVRGVTLSGNGHHGLQLGPAAVGGEIAGVITRENGQAIPGSGAGISLVGAEDVSIGPCIHIDEQGSPTQAFGILMNDGPGGPPDRIKVGKQVAIGTGGGPLTFASLSAVPGDWNVDALAQSIRTTATPGTGTNVQGALHLTPDPGASGWIGSVNTASGTPGTQRLFGPLADAGGLLPAAILPDLSATYATPASVTAAINAVIAAAPGALDTLDELAAALGDDANFAASVTTALAGKQPLHANLTALAALADPNADRILFWDDSAGTYAHLTLGTNLSISGTTLNATGGGGGAGADVGNKFLTFDTSGDLTDYRVVTQGTGVTITPGATSGDPFTIAIGQAVAADSSPTFAGLTLTGRSGLLTATAGVIGDAVAGTDYLAPTGDGSGLTALNASALSSGTVPAARLPAIAITDVFPVASQAAMLALTAERGDVAIRSDLNKSFALSTDSPGTLADWLELKTPTDAVLSVDGLTGAVSLSSVYQAADGTLAALAGLDATAGLLEQTGADAFARRALGVGASTSVPTRADADARYAAASHTHATGDITGLGALATLSTVGTSQIDADAVTYARIQNVSATDRILGRSTAGAGDVEEITCTAAGRAILDDADAAAQRSTLGTARGHRGFGVDGTPTLNAVTPPIYFDIAVTLQGLVAACETAPSGGAVTVQVQTSTDGTTWGDLSGAVVSISSGAYAGTASPTNSISAATWVRAKFTAVNGAARVAATLFLKG